MECENFIQNRPDAQNFFCMNIDVGRLSLDTAHPWLVNQNARMGKRKTLLCRAGRKKHGRHACGLPDSNGCHVVPDELNRGVYFQAGRYRPGGAVSLMSE